MHLISKYLLHTWCVQDSSWYCRYNNEQNQWCGNFPGGSLVKNAHSQCRRPGFDPWSGNCIPHDKLRERMWQQTPKVLSATSKTWRGQINTLKKKSDQEHCPHDSRQRDRYWWNIKNVTTQINAKLQLWLTSRREVHSALRIYDRWKWSSLGKLHF